MPKYSDMMTSRPHAKVPSAMNRTHFFRLPLLAALALFATTWSAAASAHVAGHAHSVRPTQTLAALDTTHMAYSQPSATSKQVGVVSAERPITAVQTVLPVLGQQGSWLKVRLPGRPNSHTGWISSDGTTSETTRWHLVVTTSHPRVLVYRDGHLVKVFPAIVGAPSTPTPTASSSSRSRSSCARPIRELRTPSP